MAARILRWVLGLTGLLIGVFLFRIAGEGFMPGYFLAILCFGMTWLLYRAKTEVPRPIMIATGVILAAAAWGASTFNLRFVEMEVDFLVAWWLWAIVLGVPGMAWAYKKYDR